MRDVTNAARGNYPFAWEPHRSCPGFGHAFRLERGLLLTQSVEPVCTARGIAFVTECVDRILSHDDPTAIGGITILHDWRSFESYESPARSLLFETMRKRPSGYARRIALAVPPTALWRMAVAGAALVYAFHRVGAPELVTDARRLLPDVLARRPEPPPAWFVAPTTS